MSDAIERQLGELQRMTTTDLVDRYGELHGHACRTRHRAYLIRKVAWRIQANAEGDLSERVTFPLNRYRREADPPAGRDVPARSSRLGSVRATRHRLQRGDGLSATHQALWHAVAMIEESFFERRYVGDQAGPGLLAHVVTQYDDVALYPPAYFHPTVGESKSNPHAKYFLLGAHLFAGTWVEANRQQYSSMWRANRT